MPADEIRLLEELAANAVPPAKLQLLDGWRLRFNYGVTRRANSVLAHSDGGRYSLAEKLDIAETFYAEEGRAPRFQVTSVSQPSGLDDALEARGYQKAALVHIMTAPVAEVAATAAGPGEARFIIEPEFSEDWYRLCAQVDNPYTEIAQTAGSGDARRELFFRLPAATGFASLRLAAVTVAVGLGVKERAYLGIFNMATDRAFRRRGLGASLLGGLADWGRLNGARTMYLQVDSRNGAARSLYEKLGFSELYSYHYREGTASG